MKIDKEQIREALRTMREYKNGRASLESRIVEDEEFWKRRHQRYINKNGDIPPTSGWMFNSICNKHADAMDSFPEIKCLPREQSDTESAKILGDILPVIMERNKFKKTYSDAWWYKLKHGCSAYGVFWDKSAENGLGDVAVTKIDLLNIFWEPGITDIEQSKNLFIVNLCDTETLKKRYPKLKLAGGNTSGDLKEYIHDDSIDTSNKSLIVDWYYKTVNKSGQTVLHLCKFVGDELIFASENEKGFEDGWYNDGKYPVVFDVLYPEADSPVGFGIISITRDAQLYIDKLDKAIMDNAMLATKPRYFVRETCGIDEKEFLDWNKPLIHCSGDVNEERLRQISVNRVDGYVANFRESKVNELKETSNNRDFSQGSVAGGVTSGAAIATLQEAGNKTSRDMINESYEVYSIIAEKIIERIRQFYDESRTFRITGNNGGTEFVNFNNSGIKAQSMGIVGESELFRKPIFDIKIKAQKMSAFSVLAQNETAMNLYAANFFNPQNAEMSLAALKLMDFEGKKDVEESIRQMQAQMQQQMQMQQQAQMQPDVPTQDEAQRLMEIENGKWKIES